MRNPKPTKIITCTSWKPKTNKHTHTRSEVETKTLKLVYIPYVLSYDSESLHNHFIIMGLFPHCWGLKEYFNIWKIFAAHVSELHCPSTLHSTATINTADSFSWWDDLNRTSEGTLFMRVFPLMPLIRVALCAHLPYATDTITLCAVAR